MHEPLTSQLVAELLQKLLAAFPRNLGTQNPAMMADVYRNGLRGMDGDAIRAAVDLAIQNDTYFPKIARLRELAGEWTKRNRATFAIRTRESWDECAVCGARAVLKSELRQARDPDTFALLWDGVDPITGPIPKMEPTPQRYVMEHKPGPHGIKVEPQEESDHHAA